jgi:hypothetical protein
MSPNAIVCVSCGVDLRTGEKMQTIAGTPNPRDDRTRFLPGNITTTADRPAVKSRPLSPVMLTVAGVGVVVACVVGYFLLASTDEPPRAVVIKQQETLTKPVSQQGQATGQKYVQYGSVKGKVHIVSNGFDLPLKSVPIYLIKVSDSFAKEFAVLKQTMAPFLVKKRALDAVLGDSSVSNEKRKEWADVTQAVINTDKQRVVLFRRCVFRTVYADLQGLFAFHDVPPDRYLIVVEGVVGDKMTDWTEEMDLKEGQHLDYDFGSHNVGDLAVIYGWGPGSTGAMAEKSAAPPTTADKATEATPEDFYWYAGKMFREGNKAEGLRWLRLAAEGGHADAQCDYGLHLLYGDGIEKNLPAGVEWVAKGAKQGNATAQYTYGLCLVGGDGVAKDENAGVQWYAKAAEQGHAEAQTRLGLAYYRGIGVPQNTSMAAKLWRQASAQGDKDAQQLLKEVTWADTLARGASKSPPDRDAAEELLAQVADVTVNAMIQNGQLIEARRTGVVVEYVAGSQRCDAKAIVGYQFTFTTQAGLQRTNPNGYIYYYHDPGRRDWFQSDMSIDGLSR